MHAEREIGMGEPNPGHHNRKQRCYHWWLGLSPMTTKVQLAVLKEQKALGSGVLGCEVGFDSEQQ